MHNSDLQICQVSHIAHVVMGANVIVLLVKLLGRDITQLYVLLV